MNVQLRAVRVEEGGKIYIVVKDPGDYGETLPIGAIVATIELPGSKFIADQMGQMFSTSPQLFSALDNLLTVAQTESILAGQPYLSGAMQRAVGEAEDSIMRVLVADEEG